ncbi:MAG: nicotinate phosphoribosyltransferase [Candidatus Parvarchaeota archaeon]|nr:nicotinate phosphoribosyltransferase [Candidatus Parvarchaeota archaeon]MCL5101213.1 nicotinate phosphoribosyltransferase [Candidatus Parvarchaeota archaeon]
MKLNNSLIEQDELALFLDYYELTGGKADFDHKNRDIITETFFFRKVPKHLGSYMIAAGLEQVISFIMNYRLSKKDGGWLKKTSGKDFNKDFLAYLENFKFKGDVYAIPEGTPVFPNEPILSITGPSIDVQLFETYILNVMNFQTLVATKASRVVNAAKGRTVLEFGARRAQGRDAAVLGARAAYIGGSVGSALVLAGKKFGIPYVGTMPHKFVQERDSEISAFREYAESFPHNAVLLIDTYDTLQGARNACTIGKELKAKGYDLKGVRLDSGDLFMLSKKVREILDFEGFKDTKIMVSSDLDEYKVNELVEKGSPIDGFGVGTRLITGANYNSLTKEGEVSALGGVYKLVEIKKEGKVIPKIKISEDIEKTTLPGKKQVYRIAESGTYSHDEISMWEELPPQGAKPLLVPVISNGKIVYDFPKLDEIKRRCGAELALIPDRYKKISGAETYPVKLSDRLSKLKQDLIEEAKSIERTIQK